MKIFFLINSNDQNGIIGIEELFCDLQTFLHHGQPLAVPILIAVVHIVVVIFPVSRTGVVGRIYVPADFDTIENAFSGAKPPKKAYNKGLSRSVFDFESPFCLYSIGV